MTTQIKWHRLFGITLIDFFTNSDYHVELEKELSLKKQYLDIAIIKKTAGIALQEKPAGLETLVEHNLLTYKSLREPLDDWAIEELIGYYCNYRKIMSPSLDNLLPASQFNLYAICTRYPSKFLNKDVIFKHIQPGVYDLTWGSRLIRIIVLNRMEKTEKNAIWQLFSGKDDGFIFGEKNYKWHRPEEKAVLNQLYQLYHVKGGKMSYTMEEFTKDFTRENLHLLKPSDRLKGLMPSDRLKGLAPSEVLTQFSPSDRLKGLTPKEIKEYLSKISTSKADDKR